MFLRANNVSIYFPLRGDIPAARLPAATGKLGGAVGTFQGQQQVHALDDVSLDLQRGDRLALIGHNGSGKSTLLRALAGIYFPQRGTVEREGTISGLFNIALGFRQEASGYRNIILKGLIAGKTRAEIMLALPEIVEFTELGPYIHMPLNSYSQGMAMRLAFSIATAFSTDILLLDEWIGAGDAHFREKVVTRMNSIVEAAHILVIASHSAPLLRRIATKAIWLEAGRIRESGSAEDLIDRYEAEAREEARSVALATRGTIRKDMIDFKVAVLRRENDGDAWPATGEVSWDVSQSGVDRVEIVLVLPDGKVVTFIRGGQIGSKMTGPWLRPALEFRLKSVDGDEVLASAVVKE
jgi:ABC-type polysaccharide/polyol phosphate transport system ATPase subunit